MTIATYAALLLAAVGLWVGPGVWIAFSGIAVALGYLSGVLYGPAVLWLTLLAGFCVLYARLKNQPPTLVYRAGMLMAAVGIAVIAVLLGLHALPGFRNYLVVKDMVFSAGAAPYTLYLNFDKGAVGVLLIGTIYRPLLRTWRDWSLALRQAAVLSVATILVLIGCSVALGYLHFDPKWNSLFWIWAAANLFLTCMSEEAFFRGFIQRELASWLGQHRRAAILTVGISAVLFGLAHFAGGWTYVALSTAAGLGYALVYHRTQRIEMAILTHFSVNAMHFLLFTYPRAA